MINLTNVFLNSAPSRFRLGFGVTTNVMLKAVSNEIRRDKNSKKINKCSYMSFAEVDPENDNKAIAESLFSYFLVDNEEYAKMNFIHQIIQSLEILRAVVPSTNNRAVVGVFNKSLQRYGKIVHLVKSKDKFSKAEIKEIAAAQMSIADVFLEVVTPYLGDAGDLVQITVVTGPNGKFLDLPREDKGFIAKASEKALQVSAKYKIWYANRNVVETDDADNIGAEEIMSDEEILTDDDSQILDGI